MGTPSEMWRQLVEQEAAEKARRLEQGKKNRMVMNETNPTTGEQTSTTPREQALTRALAVLLSSNFDRKEVAADMMVALANLEHLNALGTPHPKAKERRRALHVELVRMQLPPEVLKALRG